MSRPGDTSDDHQRTPTGDQEPDIDPDAEFDGPPIVEITEAIRPGVVSLPHGWGHTESGTRMRVAAQHPGVNVNSLNDGTLLDPLSGTAVLNAVPVQVAPVG